MFFKEEWINLLIKIGIPATIGVSIKLAVQSKKEQMSITRIILSFVIGIGCAYLAFPFLSHNTNEEYLPMFIAIVSISGEKIAEYVIYKWNIDYFLTSLFEAFRKMILKLMQK